MFLGILHPRDMMETDLIPGLLFGGPEMLVKRMGNDKFTDPINFVME